jgi:PIN domain nuclease of toxin-antitoxin system
LIALLRGEPGADRAQAAIDADAVMCTVNLAEVARHYARRGAGADDLHALLDPLPFERVPFDDELAFAASLMLPSTQRAGLSLGDRACLALAARLGAPALTTDRIWATVSEAVGVKVEVLR